MTAVLAILAAGFREITQAGPSSSCAAAVSKGLACSSRRRPPLRARSDPKSLRPALLARPSSARRSPFASRLTAYLLPSKRAAPLLFVGSVSLSPITLVAMARRLPSPTFIRGNPQHSHLTMIPPSSLGSLPSIALAIIAVLGAARLSCARLKFSAKNAPRSRDPRPASLASPTL